MTTLWTSHPFLEIVIWLIWIWTEHDLDTKDDTEKNGMLGQDTIF